MQIWLTSEKLVVCAERAFQAESRDQGSFPPTRLSSASRDHHVVRRDPPRVSSRCPWKKTWAACVAAEAQARGADPRQAGAGPGTRGPLLLALISTPPCISEPVHAASDQGYCRSAAPRCVGVKPRNDWPGYSHKHTDDFIMGKTAALPKVSGEKGSQSFTAAFAHWAIYTDGTRGWEIRTHQILILPIMAYFRTEKRSFFFFFFQLKCINKELAGSTGRNLTSAHSSSNRLPPAFPPPTPTPTPLPDAGSQPEWQLGQVQSPWGKDRGWGGSSEVLPGRNVPQYMGWKPPASVSDSGRNADSIQSKFPVSGSGISESMLLFFYDSFLKFIYF